MSALQKLESTDVRLKDIPAGVEDLRSLIEEFKRGYAKCPPSMKRRLLRKVLKGLVVKTEGLEVSFHIQDRFLSNNDSGSNVVEMASVRRPPEGEDSDLSLLSAKLPIMKVGWGTWTRTRE